VARRGTHFLGKPLPAADSNAKWCGARPLDEGPPALLAGVSGPGKNDAKIK